MNPVIPFILTLILLTANPTIATRVGPIKHQATLPSAFRQTTCNDDSDCSGNQKCLKEIHVCFEFTCSCEDPCASGSTCFTTGEVQFCIPELFSQAVPAGLIKPIECSDGPDGPSSQTGVASENAPCIGADMLNEFASHELVFKKHVLAHVLCDSAGSCATKGHIVNYKGTGMMMVNYCNIVGCKEKVMQVNSPRYQRGLKVESRSEDMHFTAFAARYETLAEEAVLAAAVRVGL